MRVRLRRCSVQRFISASTHEVKASLPTGCCPRCGTSLEAIRKKRFESSIKGDDMDLRLTGKRAIVTGSSSGIGEGIAKTLAREGAAIVVQGRNEKSARRVQHEIEAAGGKAIVAI